MKNGWIASSGQMGREQSSEISCVESSIHAMRYEWVERNPIKLVRQSAKREKTPDVLELEELQLLLSKLFVRERTLALLDAERDFASANC
jgi:site-specific recombinase XerD